MPPKQTDFVLGLDIGYSNLKLAFGPAEAVTPTTMACPSGAGKAASVGMTLSAAANDQSVQVLVDDVPWVAAVDHGRFDSGVVRELHPDYTSTAAYRALTYAGLLLSGAPEIHRLITGLPVSQYMDEAHCDRLQKALTGDHRLTPKRTVKVHAVEIVPQPAGALYDYIATPTTDVQSINDTHIVVLDPGYFSVDWLVEDRGTIRMGVSGTSTQAMSRLIEMADRRIKEDHGGQVGPERIEAAMRASRPTVSLFGQAIDLTPYLDAAAAEVAPVALTDLKKSMREIKSSVDIVILSGGGAPLYEAATREVFPKSTIIVPKEPVLANARGFWNYRP